MSILRNEIPRPLDLQHMLDLLSNPNLALLPNQSSYEASSPIPQVTALISSKLASGSAYSLSRPGSSVSSASFTIPKPPPLLSTHTNDGTTCIYYPSGQLAAIIANVFGFYIESVSLSSLGSHYLHNILY